LKIRVSVMLTLIHIWWESWDIKCTALTY